MSRGLNKADDLGEIGGDFFFVYFYLHVIFGYFSILGKYNLNEGYYCLKLGSARLHFFKKKNQFVVFN